MAKSMIILIIKPIILLLAFWAAMVLENADLERAWILIGSFGVFFVWVVFLRPILIKKNSKIIKYSFVIDIILLIYLDNNSKFVLNYYISILFLVSMVEAGRILDRKSTLISTLAILAINLYKHIFILLNAWNLKNFPYILSYISFTTGFFIVSFSFINYLKILNEEQRRLREFNEKLELTNKELDHKNCKIKELTIYEERNRIAREIHDAVGHNMIGLLLKLELTEKLMDKDASRAKEQIKECKHLAVTNLNEIRRSVRALKPPKMDNEAFIKSINELAIDSKEKFGIDIEIRTRGNMNRTTPDSNFVLYRALQESITNSVKHGGSDRMKILIKLKSQEFTAIIRDNGKGAGELTFGTGLTGMKERIEGIGGVIRFLDKKGFVTIIKIPLKRSTQYD